MTKIKIRIEKEGQTTPAKEFLIDVGNEGEYVLKIPSMGMRHLRQKMEYLRQKMGRLKLKLHAMMQRTSRLLT